MRSGVTLVSASSVEPTMKAKLAEGVRGGNVAGAKAIGALVAERLKEKGITRVVFDRGGFLYHGRVKAVADAAREAGWSFSYGYLTFTERVDSSQLELKDTVVSINRVTKVVKGGKNLSFSALVVVGDGAGHVGFGVGKAKEVPSAIKKGIEAAKKALIRVPLQGHVDSAPGGRAVRRGQRAAQAGAGRHGHHRRRRGPRGGGSGRHPEHPDQVARLGQRPQRGARDVRGPERAEGSGRASRGCAARNTREAAHAARNANAQEEDLWRRSRATAPTALAASG